MITSTLFFLLFFLFSFFLTFKNSVSHVCDYCLRSVFLSAPIASILVDKFSLRTAIIVSGVLYTIGHIGTAFANSLPLSIIAYGIIAGKKKYLCIPQF